MNGKSIDDRQAQRKVSFMSTCLKYATYTTISSVWAAGTPASCQSPKMCRLG